MLYLLFSLWPASLKVPTLRAMVNTVPLTRGGLWDPIPLCPARDGHNFGQTQQAILKHHVHILDVYDSSCEGPTQK
jgi:hypothetical protein